MIAWWSCGEPLRAGAPVEVCISREGRLVLVIDRGERQEVARIVVGTLKRTGKPFRLDPTAG